jgi:hypothetical protein
MSDFFTPPEALLLPFAKKLEQVAVDVSLAVFISEFYEFRK